jgi:molybdenum cofactor sulfurtransferase
LWVAPLFVSTLLNYLCTHFSISLPTSSSQCCGEIWGDQQTAEWFSDFLGVRCWLARFVGGAYQPIGTHLSADKTPPQRSAHVAFANEEPLLLISEHAVAALNQVLGSRGQGQVSSCHFRPNIVVRPADVNGARGGHIEDGWSRLEFIDKNMAFDVAGPCSRCSMVDVDPTSGMKGNTLETLADYRRNNGQITFGIFLRSASIDKIGDADRVISLEEGDVISCQ